MHAFLGESVVQIHCSSCVYITSLTISQIILPCTNILVSINTSKSSNSFFLAFFEFSFVLVSIGINKNPMTFPFTLLELSFIYASTLKDIPTISMIVTIRKKSIVSFTSIFLDLDSSTVFQSSNLVSMIYFCHPPFIIYELSFIIIFNNIFSPSCKCSNNI